MSRVNKFIFQRAHLSRSLLGMSCVYSSELSAPARFLFFCQSCTHFRSSHLIISFHSHEPLFSLQTSFFFFLFCCRFLFSFPPTHPPRLSVRPKGQTHSQKWTNCALALRLRRLCTRRLFFKGQREVTGILLSNIITYNSSS